PRAAAARRRQEGDVFWIQAFSGGVDILTPPWSKVKREASNVKRRTSNVRRRALNSQSPNCQSRHRQWVGGGYSNVTAPPISFPGGTTVELERQTLSIMKACEVVGVSRHTIYNWMAGGKIEYVRTAGGSVRIVTASLWKSRSQ